MRYRYFIILILFFCVTAFANAQLFRPFTSFQLIRTEHFNIIFPRESEASARRLASFADDLYREMSALLGFGLPGPIPVVITPHTDLFNGFYSPIPLPRIMLFDTPQDLEWTSFPDSFKALFTHELAHAISLATRSPSNAWLHRIFGSWVAPSLLTAPLFMIEGVAIYMESYSGFGRAKDPLARQLLRQAIHEGQFLTPFQASGLIDIPPQRGAFYEYGGLFSQWLVETYGMEKYARLWQSMGQLAPVSLNLYRSGFYSIFRQVYGMHILDAWNAFRDSLALQGIEENPNEVFPTRHHFFAERLGSITALAAGGSKLYILDNRERSVRVYDTLTGNVRSFNSSLIISTDIDVSPCGAFLLISGYQMVGERFTATVNKHRTDTGRRTRQSIRGLYRARFFRDGVIGLRSDLHNNYIVFEDSSGNSQVLFRGNNVILFSGPQALDNERIAFVASHGGARELMIYNVVSSELFRVEVDSTSNSEDELLRDEYWLRDVWRYMRGLSVSEGKLLFSHNTDDRMFKLASVCLDTMQAVFSERDFSGGVFHPVSVNGTIYYRAAFFAGDNLLRFPEPSYAISGAQTAVRLVPADRHVYGGDTPSNLSGITWAGPAARPYFALRYMNPFQLWLPLPLLRFDEVNFLSAEGFGLLSVMTDPTGRHFVTTMAFADLNYRMARVSVFSWQNTVAGFPLTLDFSDIVNTAPLLSFRETRASLTGSFMRSARRGLYGFSLGAGYLRLADDDGGESAYEWGERGRAFYYSAGFVFSNIRRTPTELFGSGLSLNLRGGNIFHTTLHEGAVEPRIEALFRASVETRFPVSFALYGAYDAGGMNLHGSSRTFGAPLFAPVASTEYLSRGFYLSWLAGAEMSLGLFSFEIQRNLSHAYFNRIFGTLALRNVLYDSSGIPNPEGIALDNDLRLAQSLVLRLGLLSSVIFPLKLAPTFIEPYLWGAWRFSNTIAGEGALWSMGIGINIRL